METENTLATDPHFLIAMLAVDAVQAVRQAADGISDALHRMDWEDNEEKMEAITRLLTEMNIVKTRAYTRAVEQLRWDMTEDEIRELAYEAYVGTWDQKAEIAGRWEKAQQARRDKTPA